MFPSPPVVIHLIPSDVIGGVEIAARSLSSGLYPLFLLKKYFIACESESKSFEPNDCAGTHQSVNDPRNFFKALLWLHFQRPNLLVASLWRAYLVLIFYKFFHPRSKGVCFIHSAGIFNIADRFIALAAILIASEVWADCHQTVLCRVPPFFHKKTKIISFVLQHHDVVNSLSPSPSFIFWGRLSKVKGIDHSLRLFATLQIIYPRACLQIVGPDGGELPYLLQLSHQLGLSDKVHFLGPKSKPEIVRLVEHVSFYLQTSLQEGMAMSVVEAMQLGLVPVVTPVGEIARYCQDGRNAVLVTEPAPTVKRISNVMNNPSLYSALRAHAIATWSEAPLYRDQFLERCSELIKH